MARFKSTLEKQSTYKIAGFDVQFPMKPYGPQFTFMHKMLTTLELSRSSSSANALLESPTGTGKSLALLCAALAWQQHCKQHGCPPQVLDAGQPGDPNAPSGGGFIPDLNASPCEEDDAAPPKSGKGKHAAKKEEKKPAIPKIYYATRTHSQVGQVVRELSKTGYRTPMAILAARKHYCTHKTISKKKDINEECKKLLLEPNGCSYNRSMSRVKTHPALQHGAVHEIHDIEDLVKLGKQVKGCSYFASRALAAEASIVFCPYNYIIDPVIRKAMNIDIKNSIIILDEAHNIEDVAREAASTCVDLVALDEVRLELQKMVHEEGQQETYQPLIDMVDGLIAWINEKSRSLKKDGQERYHNEWFSDRLLSELDAAGIQPHSLNILLSCFQKVSQQAGEAKPGELHVNGQAVATLEGLFTSLRFMLSNDARRLNDFCMVLQRFVKRGEGNRGTVWTTELSLWCLNPAVAFEEVAATARSIILTSGTLSPMDSFEKELGCQFSVTMEGSHVIDMEKQIWGGVVGVGPNDVVLNASYRSADGVDFQDSLGRAIEECASIVPDGLLIFFPSYKLMEKLSARWKSTGQWQKIAKRKPIYSEPRGGDDQFEKALAGYYSTIKKVQKRRSKVGPSKTGPIKDEGDPNQDISGATFLAVCRGKVSEGIDFADGNARAVIVVGIPFPYAMDLQVVFKKQFNTVNQKSRDLLSGDQWYCQQAFRALNQAIGRCIRHRYDFGAVLLFDERFHRPSNTHSLSKWLRGSIAKYSNFQDSMASLRNFFQRLELDPPKPAPPAAKTVATSKSSSKFHPMFNKTFDTSVRLPTPSQPANPIPPPVINLAAEPAEVLAEKLSGFRASPSGRHDEASAQKAGYVRKYEATQPTKAEKRPSKRASLKSPFWNEEGFVDPVPETLSSEGNQKPELQKQVGRPNEPLDKDSLESLEALVAECREEESRHAFPVDSGAGAGVSESWGQENDRLNSLAEADRVSPQQPVAQPRERSKNGASLLEQLGANQQPSRSSEIQASTSWQQAGPGQLLCSRCGAEVACGEVTQTSVRKAFLQDLLEQNRSGTGAPSTPLDVLLVKASALCSTSGRAANGSRAVWAQEDGCVFEPVKCPGCGMGGAVVGAKVLATDTANSVLNGQALLFPELLYRAPSKLLDRLPSDQRGPVPTPPSSVALPSPSNSGSQPLRATLLEGETSKQATQPDLYWNAQQTSQSIHSVTFPPKNEALTKSPDLLFTPAADLVSSAGHVSNLDRRTSQPMGGEPCSTTPLYVAPANGRRRSLQAWVPRRPAAVLSASEANVLNAGSPLAGRSRSSQGKATKAGGGQGGLACMPSPSSEGEATAWQDVRTRAAGKKRKLSTTKAESKRTLDVIAETDSEDEKIEKPASWRKLVKIHTE